MIFIAAENSHRHSRSVRCATDNFDYYANDNDSVGIIRFIAYGVICECVAREREKIRIVAETIHI